MLKRWETWFLIFIWIAIATMAVVGFNFIKPVHAKEVTAPLTMQCYAGNYAVMEGNLLKAYNEKPLLQGVLGGNENGNLMYIFRNENNDKWTFVYLGIDGYYCTLFYGDGLVLVSPKRKAHAQTY